MELHERFYATPLVTRHLMVAIWASCVLNPIVRLDDLVCASPYDVIRKGQVWRLVLSILYVPTVVNAFIMTFVLYRLGAAWEQERGSLRIAYYFVLAIVATNVGVCAMVRRERTKRSDPTPRPFVVVGIERNRCSLAPVAPSVLSPTFLCGPGILSAFLVLITRSSQGYAGASVSILGLFTMPALYFPLLLLAFFAVFGANPLESASSVAVGYAWAQGYLDAVIPSDATLQAVEQWSALRAVREARGYVSTSAVGPSLPTTWSAPGGRGSAGTGGGQDAIHALIQQIREHAMTRGGRTAPPAVGHRVGGHVAGPDGRSGVGGLATPAAVAADLRRGGNTGGGGGGAPGGGASSASTTNGGGVGDVMSAQVSDATPAQMSREERAAVFARAHEKRIQQQQQTAGVDGSAPGRAEVSFEGTAGSDDAATTATTGVTGPPQQPLEARANGGAHFLEDTVGGGAVQIDASDEQAMERLMEMGFSRDAALDAWIRSGRMFDSAVELLCGGGT